MKYKSPFQEEKRRKEAKEFLHLYKQGSSFRRISKLIGKSHEYVRRRVKTFYPELFV